MSKESIAMSGEEVLAFLREEHRMILGTLDEAGAPWADAAPSLVEGDALYFRISRRSRSFANIRRDDRVCCALDRYPTYYEIKGVTLHGRATPATERDAQRVGSKLDAIGDPVSGGAARDGVVFSVGIDDVVSFDFSKIKSRP